MAGSVVDRTDEIFLPFGVEVPPDKKLPKDVLEWFEKEHVKVQKLIETKTFKAEFSAAKTNPYKQGFLRKRGGVTGDASWKKRCTSSTAKQPKGAISLFNSAIFQEASVSKKNLFLLNLTTKISTSNNSTFQERTFQLSCSDEYDRRAWSEALTGKKIVLSDLQPKEEPNLAVELSISSDEEDIEKPNNENSNNENVQQNLSNSGWRKISDTQPINDENGVQNFPDQNNMSTPESIPPSIAVQDIIQDTVQDNQKIDYETEIRSFPDETFIQQNNESTPEDINSDTISENTVDLNETNNDSISIQTETIEEKEVDNSNEENNLNTKEEEKEQKIEQMNFEDLEDAFTNLQNEMDEIDSAFSILNTDTENQRVSMATEALQTLSQAFSELD